MVDDLEATQADLSERIDEVDDKTNAAVNKVEAKQEKLERKLLELERASKRLNFKIFGLLTPSEGTLREKKDLMLNEFLAGLRTAGISTESYQITADDISMSRAIRIPGQPGLVLLIRLKEDSVRDHIYKKRTQMKIVRPRKIYINEDLTKEDSIKLSKARKEMQNGRFTSVWSFNGKVYVRASNDTDPFCISDSTMATTTNASTTDSSDQ